MTAGRDCIDFQLATTTEKLMYVEPYVLCIRDGNGSSKGTYGVFYLYLLGLS